MSASTHESEAPVRVLFACTANIARSPYAERRAAMLLAAQGPGSAERVALASAGVPGVPGRAMDEEMADQLRARGGEPAGHVSRAMTRELLEGSDLVITFEFAHRLRIAQAWPDQASKVLGLRQLSEGLGRSGSGAGGLHLLDEVLHVAPHDGMHLDVADPHRRGRTAAKRCADEVDAALTLIVPALSRPTAP